MVQASWALVLSQVGEELCPPTNNYSFVLSYFLRIISLYCLVSAWIKKNRGPSQGHWDVFEYVFSKHILSFQQQPFFSKLKGETRTQTTKPSQWWRHHSTFSLAVWLDSFWGTLIGPLGHFWEYTAILTQDLSGQTTAKLSSCRDLWTRHWIESLFSYSSPKGRVVRSLHICQRWYLVPEYLQSAFWQNSQERCPRMPHSKADLQKYSNQVFT